MHAHPDLGNRSEENRGIQVALDSRPIADVHPGLIDVDPPIHTHDVPARGVQFLEETCRSGAKVNHWNTGRTDSLHQSARVRSHIADIIVGSQRAYPAIENLNHARACGHLEDAERT